MTEQSFDEYVKKTPKAVLILGASWCGYCGRTKARMPELRKLRPDVDVQFVDVDRSKRLAERLLVRDLPTILAYHGGRLVKRVAGEHTAEQMARLLPAARR